MSSNTYEQTNDLKLLFENSYDAVLILDIENLDAIDCNVAFLELFGYNSISELKINTFEKIIDIDKLPQPFHNKSFIIKIKTCIAFKKKYFEEIKIRTKSGETFWGEISISQLDYNNYSVFLCIIHDVTEKRQVSLTQQLIFNLSLKDYLSEKDMVKIVLEKALEMTNAEIAIFAYVNQETDKYNLVASLSNKGVKWQIPFELSTDKLSTTSKNLFNCINNNLPDIINIFDESELGKVENEIKRVLYAPIVIENKTKCFLGIFNKNISFSKIDLDLTIGLMQQLWLIIQTRKNVKDTSELKDNLEKVMDTNQTVEKELRENQERFKKLILNMMDEVWVFDKDGKIVEANESACKDTQYSMEELRKLKFFEICPTIRRTEFSDFFQLICKEDTLQFEGKFKRKDGSYFDFDLFASVQEMDDLQYIICSARDISEQKKDVEALLKSERKYRTVMDQALEMIILCEIDGTIKEVNEMTCKVLGYTEYELISQNYTKFLTNKTINYLSKIKLNINVNSDLNSNLKNNFELKERVIRKDGSRLVGNIRGKIIEIESEKYLLLSIRDATEELEREEKIRLLNFHDKISGLYNKMFFEAEIKRLDFGINLPISIIIGDINGLKLTNNTYGYAVGDKLINTVASIIMGCCRSEDIVARWSGDEFVVLLPNADERICESICKTILGVCNEYKDKSLDIDEVIDPSVSFGYSTKNHESEDIRDTLKNAENFMYKRKMLDKKSMHSSLVHSMKNTLYEKKFDSEEYSARLNLISKKIGVDLGLPDNELNELELLSILHDVGKIVIDGYVINKDENLSENDWREIKKHPEVGYRIIKSSPELASIAEDVLSHHERWDGKGYPQGLCGEEIPLKARIIAVADAYAAMTQDKSYRKTMQIEQAKLELTKNSDTQFDKKIVKVFLKILEKDKYL